MIWIYLEDRLDSEWPLGPPQQLRITHLRNVGHTQHALT